MFDIENFCLFLIASLVLNLAPGNDMLFVISRTLSNGVSGGFFSSIGVFIGCMFHIILATAGLSALVMKFAVAYDVIRFTGAAYLFYLGINELINKKEFPAGDTTVEKTSNRNLVLQGIITDVLNPKVALFFLAFLPQFVNPGSPHAWIQFFTLGLLFNVMGTIMFILLVLFLARTTTLLKQTLFWQYQKKITGVILIGLGLNVALWGKK